MKLITRNTDYALRALCFISKQKGVVTVAELVKKLSVPRPFMRKILQDLNKAKILESFKGQGGGFKLIRKPKEITIFEVMCIFQHRCSLDGCFLKKDLCPNISKCVLRKKISAIEGNVIKQFKAINIATLT